MKERAPKNTGGNANEAIEPKGPDGVWHQLQEDALAEVAKLINNIDGFDLMSPQEQIDVLKEQLVVIALREDNSERYKFEVLGNKIREMELRAQVSKLENEISKFGINVNMKA